MNDIERLFLEALGESLRGGHVRWSGPMSTQDWAALFRLAQRHQVLPMICGAVHDCPAAQHADGQLMRAVRKGALRSAALQARRSGEFLALMRHLRAAGVTPCVVKGIVCRSLYPQPDCRISGDEDVLIAPGQFDRCHEALLAFGMRSSVPQQDMQTAHEIAYGKRGSPLCIELHRQLFPPENDAYGDLNRLFADVHPVELAVDGVPLTTLHPTEHFFYLICHAFKHFLHSGFGIRQVCDIVLFAGRHGQEIDWEAVLAGCRSIRAEQFTAALLKIGEAYLGFDPIAARCPQAWRESAVEIGPLLADLLDGGIYGDASMSRRHSSTLTLGAAAADRRGRRTQAGVLRALFPSRLAMEARCPLLRRRPWLLPLAWARRIARYAAEPRAGGTDNRAAQSLRIGSERVALLRLYGMIKP